MPEAACDLVLAGARVIDPETGLDAVRAVVGTGGTITAAAETPPPAHTHTPTQTAPVRRSLPSVSIDQKAVVALVVGGVVLTALLAAVAVTAISVAVAVVLRSMLRDHRR